MADRRETEQVLIPLASFPSPLLQIHIPLHIFPLVLLLLERHIGDGLLLCWDVWL